MLYISLPLYFSIAKQVLNIKCATKFVKKKKLASFVLYGILGHLFRGFLHLLMDVKVLVTQSCPTLCKLMDCSPPSSSVHEILCAKILEWVVMPFSRGSSQPRD